MLDTYLNIVELFKWVNPSGGSKGPPHLECGTFKVGVVMDHLLPKKVQQRGLVFKCKLVTVERV